MASASPADEVIILCVEESETLVEPMCSTQELQQDLVPYVLSHSLQNPKFLKMAKPQRQIRVKALTQLLLSGEFSGQGAEQEDSEISPQRFWSHLRAKYGTQQKHMEQFLKLMEPHFRRRRVVVLRFEGEVAMPAVSLVVRSSEPCRSASSEQSSVRREYQANAFDAAALCTWLFQEDKASKSIRAPPLWPQLMAECRKCKEAYVHAFVLCTETQSTDTAPEALQLAAHSLHKDREVVPFLSSVAFGPQSSEHLAALEELCAWAGGLSLNVGEPGAIHPAAEGLAAHVFGVGTQPSGLSERREFYARKQALGKCFLKLPELARQASATPPSTQGCESILRILSSANGHGFDGSLPSEAMLAVLSDVNMTLQRRWGASLRIWRMHRGLRDIVFSEAGNLGLEFDEPQTIGNDPSKRSWRLRATHPPASSLKMEEQSVLVAINHCRVNHLTPRSEVARRIAARPVSLTFRSPGGGDGAVEATLPFGGAMLAMATAEVVVSELREGLTPLKKAAPPLSIALQRVAAAGGCPRQRQAKKLLELASCLEVADLPRSPQSLLNEPALLYRLLLYCGDATTIAFAGGACSHWKTFLLDGAQEAKSSSSSSSSSSQKPGHGAQRLLWRWTLRWGCGPSSAQRIGFWRWILRSERAPNGSAPATSALDATTILSEAFNADASGLLEIGIGLGGAALGAHLATSMASRIASALNGLPADVLRPLLEPPFYLQRMWLLTSSGLPWLVHQGRCFQVALAAHHPNVFQHLFAEGVAPELFFCLWSQALLQGLAGNSEMARIWDLFVFERSHKVLIRTAVAIFMLLEKKLLGKNDDRIMQVLFKPENWELQEGSLYQKALHTKVTRSMLRVIAESSVPRAHDCE